ncbi:MAG: hypothetical protein ABSH33_08005 [Steroidobacteraceae bacterium]|jgi:hypothetical protein
MDALQGTLNSLGAVALCLAFSVMTPVCADTPQDSSRAHADAPAPPALQSNAAKKSDKPAFADVLAQADNDVKTSRLTPEATVLVEDALRKCYVSKDLQCSRAIDLNDRKWKEEFSERSFNWHLFSSKLIFFLVIGIVVFGLYVTYLQFNRDYRDWSVTSHHPRLPPTAGVPSDGPAAAESNEIARPVSSLKISAGGLELSSQVIGLIVLALSFAFFYLYVKEVYPMVETRTILVPPMDSSSSK